MKCFDLVCSKSIVDWNFAKYINAFIKLLDQRFIFVLISLDPLGDLIDLTFEVIVADVEVLVSHLNRCNFSLIHIKNLLILCYALPKLQIESFHLLILFKAMMFNFKDIFIDFGQPFIIFSIFEVALEASFEVLFQ